MTDQEKVKSKHVLTYNMSWCDAKKKNTFLRASDIFFRQECHY